MPQILIIGNVQGAAYEQALEYLRPGGNLMVVGLPAQAEVRAPIFWTVIKGLSILGSYVGCAPSPLLSLFERDHGRVDCNYY